MWSTTPREQRRSLLNLHARLECATYPSLTMVKRALRCLRERLGVILQDWLASGSEHGTWAEAHPLPHILRAAL